MTNERAKIIYFDDKLVIKEVYDEQYYKNTVEMYEHIKHIKYVPNMKFEENKIIIPNCGISLNNVKINNKDKTKIKFQLIEFIKQIFEAKIAHRDLHTKNICWDGEQIWIIDWEFSTTCDCKNIIQHYDLTGEGLCSPLKTRNMNIFKDHPYSLINWLKPVKISIKEFK